MALTKAEIINAVQGEGGFTKQQSTAIIENLIEIIKNTLESGEDVLISGFGKFCVREKNERKGRNPATGEEITIPAKPAQGVPKISFSSYLKERAAEFDFEEEQE